MDARHDIRPSHITPSDEPLGLFQLVRTVVKNPMQIWPAAIYREPLVRWRALRQDMVFVTSPDLIREVLVEQADAFDKGELMRRALKPAIGEAILTANGAHWRWQRRAAAPIFRQEVVLGFVPIMVEAAERTGERWLSSAPGSEFNVSHEMMRTTFDVVLGTMLSGRAKMDVVRIENAITHYLESIGWVTALALFRAPRWMPYPGCLRARRARNYLKAVLAQAVVDCRRQGGGTNDLVARLMAASDPETGQSMSDRDLADNLLTFITAGHETTAVALAWTFYLLSLDPAAEERVVREIATVPGGARWRRAHRGAGLHAARCSSRRCGLIRRFRSSTAARRATCGSAPRPFPGACRFTFPSMRCTGTSRSGTTPTGSIRTVSPPRP